MLDTGAERGSDPMYDYIAPLIERAAVDEPILRMVPLPALGNVWPEVASLIEKMVERSDGRWSVETVARMLMTGKWAMWVVWEGEPNGVTAVLATELYTEDTGLPLARIVFCTGRGAEHWVHLIREVEDWARNSGAVKLEMMARKGWVKHLPDYKLTHVLIEKDLA